MDHLKNRYYIELQPETSAPVPRYRETELRREQAAQFIDFIRSWLRQQALADKVSGLAITALGQVLITCDDDIISQIRSQDVMAIAAIRQSPVFADGLSRWSEAR